MRSKIFTVVIFLLIFLTGSAVGWGYSWWRYSKTMGEQVNLNYKIFSSMVYAYEFEEAGKQYQSPNSELAIYVLERALRNGTAAKPPYFSDRQISWDSAIVHARLGKLYQDAGNKQLSDVHLAQAVKDFEKFGWKLDIREVLKVLPFINAKQSVEAMKKFGTSAKTGHPFS